MKNIVLSFILIILSNIMFAQNILTIENEDISLDEFKGIFYKNNTSSDITKEYLDEYIQLFINFKLKVTEAKELGMDTNLSFLNELEGYRQQLAKPYLRNKEFDRKLLIESYNRMQKDIF